MDCNGMSIAPTIPKKNSGDALERIFASEKPANVLTARMMEIEAAQTIVAVSYTHLTLPTIYSV